MKNSTLINAAVLMAAAGTTSMAAPVISFDVPPAVYQIEARARNGNTGFEGILFTPANAPVDFANANPGYQGNIGGEGSQLNPSGSPAWNYNEYYDFEFCYDSVLGKTVWSVDFNRDGDFLDTAEMTMSITPAYAGFGFQYLNIYGQGNTSTTATEVDVLVDDLIVNGSLIGSYDTAGANPDAFNVLLEDSSGLFTDVKVEGALRFTGNGGSERPRLWVQLGTPTQIPSSVPDAGATAALLGLGFAGIAAIRRKLNA
ncbi:MAG: VPDSG-CTERM sorting domain-containing protein [Verrucomicrobiae bacterium]|nr:VPDSG-CTERM sorting domain-containing protein [Verrucomicrobiae bacterium]